MKLTREQIKSITFGSVLVKDGADGLAFYKCTDRQLDAFMALSRELHRNASASTGIRFDFVTDSKMFSATAVNGGKYEIIVNGVLKTRIVCERKPTRFAIKLDSGENRVTLIMPSHDVVSVISDVELSEGAQFRPYTYSRKILFIGDSITQGWNSHFDSMSYAFRTASMLDADCVIQGVGGSYCDDSVFERIDFEPDIVVVAYGTNDYGVRKTKESLTAHLHSYLDLVKTAYGDKKIFAVSPIHRFDAERTIGTHKECNAIIKNEIKAHGFVLVDGDTLVPPLTEFYADYLHPNDLGFGVYAEKLTAIIKCHL